MLPTTSVPVVVSPVWAIAASEQKRFKAIDAQSDLLSMPLGIAIQWPSQTASDQYFGVEVASWQEVPKKAATETRFPRQ